MPRFSNSKLNSKNPFSLSISKENSSSVLFFVFERAISITDFHTLTASIGFPIGVFLRSEAFEEKGPTTTYRFRIHRRAFTYQRSFAYACRDRSSNDRPFAKATLPDIYIYIYMSICIYTQYIHIYMYVRIHTYIYLSRDLRYYWKIERKKEGRDWED